MLMCTKFSKLNAMLWLHMFLTRILFSSSASERVITLPKDLEDSPGIREIVTNVVETRCLIHANREAFIELKDAYFNFRYCMHEISQPPINETDIEKIASVRYKSMREAYQCLENLLKKTVPCLYLDERYLPELLLNAHNANTDRLFKDDAKNFKATVAAFQSANCTLGIRDLPANLIETCGPKLDHVKALIVTRYVLKVADFCYDLNIAKSHCNNDEDFVRHTKEMFEYYLNFCKNNVAADSEITQVIFE